VGIGSNDAGSGEGVTSFLQLRGRGTEVVCEFVFQTRVRNVCRPCGGLAFWLLGTRLLRAGLDISARCGAVAEERASARHGPKEDPVASLRGEDVQRIGAFTPVD